MRYRLALLFVAAVLVASPVVAVAQVARVFRVGILGVNPLPDHAPNAVLTARGQTSPRWVAFQAGLRERGYVEGRGIIVEYRSARDLNRLPDAARDLVRLNVDGIVASANPMIAAARQATDRIPIVMVVPTDPVGTGFVTSLARPGGNVTGLATQTEHLVSKRVQLAREVVPKLTRLAVLWDTGEPGRLPLARETEAVARQVGIRVTLSGVGTTADLEPAFTAMARDGAGAAIVIPGAMLAANRARVTELAIARRIATICGIPEDVAGGCLTSYAPEFGALYRRAAHYIDRILKGARPADLPVEQPTAFELVVNARTARALGIALPPAMLAAADRVIE